MKINMYICSIIKSSRLVIFSKISDFSGQETL